MDGLTAKVFRTYNASITLQDQLDKLTNRYFFKFLIKLFFKYFKLMIQSMQSYFHIIVNFF